MGTNMSEHASSAWWSQVFGSGQQHRRVALSIIDLGCDVTQTLIDQAIAADLERGWHV